MDFLFQERFIPENLLSVVGHGGIQLLLSPTHGLYEAESFESIHLFATPFGFDNSCILFKHLFEGGRYLHLNPWFNHVIKTKPYKHLYHYLDGLSGIKTL